MASIFENVGHVWMGLCVFGAAVAGYSGYRMDEINDKRWQATMAFESSVAQDALVKEFFDKQWRELVETQRNAEKSTLMAATITWGNDFKDKLEARVSNDDERQKMEKVLGEPHNTWLTSMGMIGGGIFILGGFFGWYKKEHPNGRF